MINKEIEEMAKAICSACDDGVATCNRKPCSLAIEEATAVFNLGYRKIDKDSVVLKIKELEDTCNKCHWVTDYKILKYHDEEVIKLCEQEVAQARKETAKEFAERLEQICMSRDRWDYYKDTKLFYEGSVRVKDINELLEEYAEREWTYLKI